MSINEQPTNPIIVVVYDAKFYRSTPPSQSQIMRRRTPIYEGIDGSDSGSGSGIEIKDFAKYVIERNYNSKGNTEVCTDEEQ